MATKRLRLPAKIIAYVMESFDGLPHGHYMKRLPSIGCVVGDNRYDAFPAPSENAIIVVIAYSDAERNMFHDRAKIAREQHSKAYSKMENARKWLTQASADAARLSGAKKERAEGAAVQFEDQVNVAEREVERLAVIMKEMDARIADWQAQESIKVEAADWNANTFLLAVDDQLAEISDTSLETVKDLLRSGDTFTVNEIRMVLPPLELQFDQVEQFLLSQDRTESKPRVSHIVQKIKDQRENAAQRVDLPVVPPESNVPGGDDDQGPEPPEPVPALSGATAAVSEPGESKVDAVKPDRRKRS